MGIDRPSLYAAFGSKEELFRKALPLCEGPAAFVREALNEPTARGVAERLLGGTIDLVTDRRNPRGCLIVQSALACGGSADPSVGKWPRVVWRGEGRPPPRFERARADGDLPEEADPADLARYVVTVMRGMSVQAPAVRAARTCTRCGAGVAAGRGEIIEAEAPESWSVSLAGLRRTSRIDHLPPA